MSQPLNLDHQAAAYGSEIVQRWLQANHGKDPAGLENAIRRTLGIVQDNGVAAAALFLARQQQKEARKEEKTAKAIIATLSKIAQSGTGEAHTQGLDLLNYLLQRVTGDLDRLLLVKEFWEQTLIYARYAAAALESPE